MTVKNNYKNLKIYVQKMNKTNSINFDIDTIRIKFSKQYKLEELKAIGEWHKLDKTKKQIFNKLKKRLDREELTSVYQLEDYNIYFYNSREDRPKYRKATLVIFGIKQYYRTPIPDELIEKLFNLLTFKTSKNDISLDVCYDTQSKPNVNNLKVFFEVSEYKNSCYIEKTEIENLDKVCIYNKQIKNNLDFECYRIEATITVPNIRELALPLTEFKNIIEIAKG